MFHAIFHDALGDESKIFISLGGEVSGYIPLAVFRIGKLEEIGVFGKELAMASSTSSFDEDLHQNLSI